MLLAVSFSHFFVHPQFGVLGYLRIFDVFHDFGVLGDLHIFDVFHDFGVLRVLYIVGGGPVTIVREYCAHR